MPAPPPRPRSALADRDLGKPRELSAGALVLGRYTVQKVLGRGGMATVYLAKHQQTERLVALKLLDPEISRDPTYLERFRREARAAGRIRSEYVVAIYDLDAEVGGVLVLVMEYMEGQTVQQALRQGRMPPQKVLLFGSQMLEGLAAAHACNVIHRDLKPANLYVERSATGVEKCKILDFGISKVADSAGAELTRDGQTLGTVAYMAPEQIRGKAALGDPRVDLYASAVSLFVMLTGKRPIDADDPVQLLAAVLENPPATLAQAAGTSFPPSFEAFMAKSLQKDPNLRYQTALEMRQALIDAGRAAGLDAGTGPVPAVTGAPSPPSASKGPSMPEPGAVTPASGVVEKRGTGPTPSAPRVPLPAAGRRPGTAPPPAPPAAPAAKDPEPRAPADSAEDPFAVTVIGSELPNFADIMANPFGAPRSPPGASHPAPAPSAPIGAPMGPPARSPSGPYPAAQLPNPPAAFISPGGAPIPSFQVGPMPASFPGAALRAQTGPFPIPHMNPQRTLPPGFPSIAPQLQPTGPYAAIAPPLNQPVAPMPSIGSMTIPPLGHANMLNPGSDPRMMAGGATASLPIATRSRPGPMLPIIAVGAVGVLVLIIVIAVAMTHHRPMGASVPITRAAVPTGPATSPTPGVVRTPTPAVPPATPPTNTAPPATAGQPEANTGESAPPPQAGNDNSQTQAPAGSNANSGAQGTGAHGTQPGAHHHPRAHETIDPNAPF